MIWVIAIPLELEMYIWTRSDGTWIFNTEYGYISCRFQRATVYIEQALMPGVRREWVLEDVKDFNPEDKLLMMFVIDELISKGLPHHHIGIYLRYIENI